MVMLFIFANQSVIYRLCISTPFNPQEVETLKRSNEALSKDNDNKNNDVVNLRKSFTKLNEDLKKAVVSKESLEQNAQSILQKLDQKADAVAREKAQLEKIAEEKQAEVVALTESNSALERESASLKERVILLQQQEVSQEQLQGLMDRCAQLSYEKGELESQVGELDKPRIGRHPCKNN